MSDIFLSYAKEDRERIRPLAAALEARGWSVFWDRIIPTGKTWRQVITQEIRSCRAVLVIWSRQSVESDWVNEEAEEGRRRRILLPVLMEEVNPPFGFGSLQAADLTRWDGSSEAPVFRRLAQDISQVPGMPKPVPRRPQRPELGVSRAETRTTPQTEAERLLDEIADPSMSHERRATIGDRLAEIGDPRPGVGLRADGLPYIAWCEVPQGEVRLKDVEGTFRVKPFRIAKYPVTWAQYRSFLKAEDGYRQREWWKGLSKERDETPGEQSRPLGNHPAENVSWFDAVAFCRWLSRRLGQEMRLPTEWEWQQAATGGDQANVYPWGPEWDSTRANTGESLLGRTTAVGLYPGGAWPGGPLDMSGNVWEWCLNEYEDPRRIGTEGAVPRVLRGGAWGFNPAYARAASRFRFYPNDRSVSIGFRVAGPSPISPGGSDP